MSSQVASATDTPGIPHGSDQLSVSLVVDPLPVSIWHAYKDGLLALTPCPSGGATLVSLRPLSGSMGVGTTPPLGMSGVVVVGPTESRSTVSSDSSVSTWLCSNVLESKIVLYTYTDFVGPVKAVCYAFRVKADPSCLSGLSIKFQVGLVMHPDSLSPLAHCRKIGLLSCECLMWGGLL